MIIKSLSVQGFKSFTEKQTVDFNDFPTGFYFLTGENKVEPELGANGAGKSTLFEALCFVLYGKTSTNLKAGDIANWNKEKECVVELEFEKDNKEYKLVRQWNPNSIKLYEDNKAETKIIQEDLEKIIGFGFSSFLYSTFISQFGSKFFDLSPAEKLTVFSDLLNLDSWNQYSEKAKLITKEIETDITALESKISFKNGQLKTLKDKNYDEDIKNWKNSKKEREHKLQQEKDVLDRDLSDNKEEIDETKEDLKKLEKTKKDSKIEEELDKLNESLNTSEENLANADEGINELNYELNSWEKEEEKFSNVEDSCPYCDQKVTEKYLEEQITNIKNNKNMLNKAINKELQEHSKYQEEVDYLRKSLENKLDALEECNLDIDNHVKYVESLKNTIKTIESNISNNLKNILEIRNEENPFKNVIEKDEKEIVNLTQKLKTLNDHLVELYEDLDIYKYWIKGFKEIRLFIVEQSLSEFEIRVNNILNNLGLEGWGIKFQVDSVTKSNTIRKGFTVLVKSPVNEELVPFDCWSGGESQRLRLAGTLGLATLIRDKTGTDMSIIVWDEPTQWLSSEGIDDLLNVLKDYTINNNLSGFLVDHRNLENYGCFRGMLKIIKDAEGSRIV